jgi:hypothetical protein
MHRHHPPLAPTAKGVSSSSVRSLTPMTFDHAKGWLMRYMVSFQ